MKKLWIWACWIHETHWNYFDALWISQPRTKYCHFMAMIPTLILSVHNAVTNSKVAKKGILLFTRTLPGFQYSCCIPKRKNKQWHTNHTYKLINIKQTVNYKFAEYIYVYYNILKSIDNFWNSKEKKLLSVFVDLFLQSKNCWIIIMRLKLLEIVCLAV